MKKLVKDLVDIKLVPKELHESFQQLAGIEVEIEPEVKEVEKIVEKPIEKVVEKIVEKEVVKTDFTPEEFAKNFKEQIETIRKEARTGFIKPEEYKIEENDFYKQVLADKVKFETELKTKEDKLSKVENNYVEVNEENALLRSKVDYAFAEKAKLLATAEYKKLPVDEEITLEKRIAIYDKIAEDTKWVKTADFGSGFKKGTGKENQEDLEMKEILGLK